MVADFSRLGFLGQEIDEIMGSYLNENAAWYDFMQELNIFANEIRYKFDIKQDDPRTVIAAALFIKTTNSFQAIVLLSKKGLGVDASAITRSLMEVVFPLKILSQEEDFVYEFLLTEKVKQLKLINVILQDKESFSTIRDNTSEEHRDRLKQEVENDKARDFSVEELSKRAGMKVFYQLAYRHLSDDAHTTIWSLKKYLRTDEVGNIAELDNGEQLFGFSNFRTTALCLLIALDSVNDVFHLGFQQEIKEFEYRILNFKQEGND
jgi:superfamily I DNA and/or RNA helicase